MSGSRGKLAIVVVNFGSSELLARNLAPTVRDCAPELVVVVDCFSSDEERRRLRALADGTGWEVVLLPDNRGFGGGMNAGMLRARELGATMYLLLNPDARIGRDAVEMLRGIGTADPLVLASPRIVDGDGRPWFTGADVYLADGATKASARRGDSPDTARWEWISGACMMLTEHLRERVGGFDESYFLYWEDVDLSRRVVAAGGRLRVVNGASAEHDEGGTHEDRSDSRAKSGTYYRYMIRNRMLFATKHLDASGMRRWRRSALGNAWAIVMQGGRRQLLKHPLRPLGAAWRGLREGRALVSKKLSDLPSAGDTER